MTTDLDSIHGAIELVAAGHARRITLSGLRYGERLLPRATAEAAQIGVAVDLDRGEHGTSALVVRLTRG
jgi:hypothetical protein